MPVRRSWAFSSLANRVRLPLSGTEFLHPTRVAAGMKGFQSGPIETIEILVAFTPPEFDDTTSQLLGGPGETHLDASNR